LTQSDTDDLNAVRINIPLSRINSVEKTELPPFVGLISFTFDPTSAQNGVPTEQSASTAEEASVIDTPPVKQVLQLGVLREDPLWENIMTYANKAKAEASKSDVDWQGSRVFIDLDPRTGNGIETSDTNLSDQVKSVAFALGLDTTKEMWSMFHLISNYALKSLSNALPVKKAHVHRFFGSYYGRFVVNSECVGFWSKSVTGGNIRYRVPLPHVKAVKPHDHGRVRDYTLVLEIQGQRDLRLGFPTEKKRDEAIEQVNRFMNLSRDLHTVVSTPVSLSPAPSRSATIDEVQTQRRTQTLDQISESEPLSSDPSPPHIVRSPTSILAPLSRVPTTVQRQHFPHALKSVFPKAINVPDDVLLSMPSMHFACLTIGSRGDVQPYIALGRGLQKEGHRVTIVTHEEYKEWVTGFGLEHRTAGGDPGALMKLSVENKVGDHGGPTTVSKLIPFVFADVFPSVLQGEPV
jgi:sterol 3beta-glucosyltransferase